jgi:hypothetical protein
MATHHYQLTDPPAETRTLDGLARLSTCIFSRVSYGQFPIMNTCQQYRQGDVLIEQITEIPAHTERQETAKAVILAHGEATGHHHTLECAGLVESWKPVSPLRFNPGSTALQDELFLSLPEPARVTHPEHAPVNLPPGRFRVIRQREYTPAAPRPVGD